MRLDQLREVDRARARRPGARRREARCGGGRGRRRGRRLGRRGPAAAGEEERGDGERAKRIGSIVESLRARSTRRPPGAAAGSSEARRRTPPRSATSRCARRPRRRGSGAAGSGSTVQSMPGADDVVGDERDADPDGREADRALRLRGADRAPRRGSRRAGRRRRRRPRGRGRGGRAPTRGRAGRRARRRSGPRAGRCSWTTRTNSSQVTVSSGPSQRRIGRGPIAKSATPCSTASSSRLRCRNSWIRIEMFGMALVPDADVRGQHADRHREHGRDLELAEPRARARSARPAGRARRRARRAVPRAAARARPASATTPRGRRSSRRPVQLLLERPDVLRERRLRDADPPRRARERAFVHDRDEALELAEVHRQNLSRRMVSCALDLCG